MAKVEKHTPTATEKRIIAFWSRPKPDFTAWRAARAAEEKKREAGEVKAAATAEVGDIMPDGTIYAGISPDTHEEMYAAPVDAPLSLDFNQAAAYAKNLEVGGKTDFRVPTENELDVLFQNKDKGALKGTFNLTGSSPDGRYWSSTLYGYDGARCQRLSDGIQSGDLRSYGLSVRPVRS